MRNSASWASVALIVLLVFVTSAARGQDIRKHYVSKSDGDATLYHTFPCALFENKAGDLTYDITYRDRGDGRLTLNFTYLSDQMLPADSVRFVSGTCVMHGPVAKIYLSPDKKLWKHRYTFSTQVSKLYTFYNAAVTPSVTIYSKGRAIDYQVKASAWRSYAPVGEKIFRMIRINEE